MPRRSLKKRRGFSAGNGSPFLRGERIVLRPLLPKDARGPYAAWFNDTEVCAGNSHHLYPYSARQALAYIERSHAAGGQLVLAIDLAVQRKHIGNIALKRIDPVVRSAEFTIVIGDKTCWGEGYSKEATRLLLDHAFFSLNLRRVFCGTFASNVPMRHLAAFLGMKEEGRRRQAAFKRNRFLDVIEYGLLRSEYIRRFGVPS